MQKVSRGLNKYFKNYGTQRPVSEICLVITKLNDNKLFQRVILKISTKSALCLTCGSHNWHRTNFGWFCFALFSLVLLFTFKTQLGSFHVLMEKANQSILIVIINMLGQLATFSCSSMLFFPHLYCQLRKPQFKHN